MAHDVAAGPAKGKLVIRNLGLILSGELERPLLDGDAIIVVDGRNPGDRPRGRARPRRRGSGDRREGLRRVARG